MEGHEIAIQFFLAPASPAGHVSGMARHTRWLSPNERHRITVLSFVEDKTIRRNGEPVREASVLRIQAAMKELGITIGRREVTAA